jgi:hypothetical protein
MFVPRLRLRPRSWVPLLLATIVACVVVAAAGALAGVGLSLLLPTGIGGIRDLVGIALGIAGCLGATWLFFALRSLLAGVLSWMVSSVRAGGPAPIGRFLRLEVPDVILGGFVTAALIAAIPLLLVWGMFILADSVNHGLSDATLVSQLRQGGVTAEGRVINVPQYSTGSNGNTIVTPQTTLEFTTSNGQAIQTPDPAIAGWMWAINPAVSVPIVYEPGDPQVAAVRGQITGSVWHGAPTGNVIGGSLAILAEPVLIWVVVRRFSAARRKAARELTKGLA